MQIDGLESQIALGEALLKNGTDDEVRRFCNRRAGYELWKRLKIEAEELKEKGALTEAETLRLTQIDGAFSRMRECATPVTLR